MSDENQNAIAGGLLGATLASILWLLVFVR